MQTNGPLVAWYGDDFTGAAATMEVLSFAGLTSMLFLAPPTDEQLKRFPNLKGIGVASTARAEGPDWMRAELPGIFARLAELKPGLLHYKVCSTLDSSPEIGSIGCAIEIGADLTGARVVPVVIAAPQMRRYQIFGQLFAAHGETVYRLDRHPVMSRHPVTPMSEAEVAAHIARQSERILGSAFTLEQMADGSSLPSAIETSDADGITVVAIDNWDTTSEAQVGKLVWEKRKSAPFVVGSQGVEYALVGHWRKDGTLTRSPTVKGIGRAERMMSVSGSVSPTTADQIAWSGANGFECISFDAARICGGAKDTDAEIQRSVDAALTALSQGRDPLLHSAAGPDDPAVARFREAVASTGQDMATANRTVSEALGQVLVRVLERTGTTRAVVSGGDTSGFVTRQLGIYALSAVAPTIPGASICRTHAEGPMDGLELALKGGQMGTPDYFGWVRDGGGAR